MSKKHLKNTNSRNTITLKTRKASDHRRHPEDIKLDSQSLKNILNKTHWFFSEADVGRCSGSDPFYLIPVESCTCTVPVRQPTTLV